MGDNTEDGRPLSGRRAAGTGGLRGVHSSEDDLVHDAPRCQRESPGDDQGAHIGGTHGRGVGDDIATPDPAHGIGERQERCDRQEMDRAPDAPQPYGVNEGAITRLIRGKREQHIFGVGHAPKACRG